jgi:hypothetical protein
VGGFYSEVALQNCRNTKEEEDHPLTLSHSRLRPHFLIASGLYTTSPPASERERERLLSWTKAGKDGKGRSKTTRSEGDNLEESAARALMRHGGRGRGGSG